MKFSYVIFICPLVIASTMATVQLIHTTLDYCDPDQWMITNTTIEYINNTKLIMCNIIYKQPFNDTIYEVHIEIGGCTNHTCIEEPIVWVKGIDCKNPKESDMSICDVANGLGQFEKKKQWLIHRYGIWGAKSLYNFAFCLTVDNTNFSWDDSDESK